MLQTSHDLCAGYAFKDTEASHTNTVEDQIQLRYEIP